ncbi:MAG: HNH endonuclease signature motif containing protein [Actinomycetota bacterium]|nr:HNH endonuclease signature motif containing protein [Actinomycetota bacterium]
MSHVDMDGPGGCWLWLGGVDRHGYGKFELPSRTVKAHRFSYELHVGSIPPGLVIDHVREWGCRHRSCVNPDHLEPVTVRENTVRGIAARASSINH